MGNSALKPDGWHSRRHETDEAQTAARFAHASRREGRRSQRFDHRRREWVKYDRPQPISVDL